MDHFTLPLNIKNGIPDLAKKMEEAIEAFCGITDIPVTFFNNQGVIEWECHKQSKFCNFFDVYQDPGSVCMKNLVSSSRLAAQLGEPYVFVCKAGLVKIAVSLIINGQVAGSFMAGPIIMGGLKESVITNVFALNNIHFDSYPKIILFLRGMKVLKPKEVSYLSALLGNSILAAITPNSDYSSINSQYKEQKRIGENLQKYKKENRTMPYPYELESKLIEHVKDGDTKSSLEVFKKFLGEISLIEVGDLSSIKTKILGVCTILSRIATERSNLPQEQTESYFYDMNVLNQAVSFQELSILASNLIESIAQEVASSTYSGSSQIIKLAIQNINENYKNKVSLKTVADHLHTNPSYLSTLFKQEMGVTFTDYLNQIRINRSCELLADSSLSLIDISIQCGFDGQSYFTKVFRKIKGVTPKDYRKSRSR